MGYVRWENMSQAVERAQAAAENTGVTCNFLRSQKVGTPASVAPPWPPAVDPASVAVAVVLRLAVAGHVPGGGPGPPRLDGRSRPVSATPGPPPPSTPDCDYSHGQWPPAFPQEQRG